MNKLVRELKQVMKEKDVSRERASHFLNVSPMTIYRWFKNSFSPNMASKRIIKEGIDKIREAYPTTVYELMLKAKSLYDKIKCNVTVEEKANLFFINQSEGTEAYIKALEELVKKYAPDKRQVQMFNPNSKK